jgi:hypothetical protein
LTARRLCAVGNLLTKKTGPVLWYPTQAKTGLDPDFLPRCAREIRACAFHQGKAHGVHQRHKLHRKSGPWGTEPLLPVKKECRRELSG